MDKVVLEHVNAILADPLTNFCSVQKYPGIRWNVTVAYHRCYATWTILYSGQEWTGLSAEEVRTWFCDRLRIESDPNPVDRKERVDRRFAALMANLSPEAVRDTALASRAEASERCH